MKASGAMSERAERQVGPTDPPAAERPSRNRAVDASMDLLNQIIRHPVDPDYALVAQRGGTPPRLRWGLALVAVLIGAMFAVSALQTTRTAPALAVERAELISRVQAAEAQQDELRARATSLSTEIAKLRAAGLGTDDQAELLEAQINALDPIVGNVAVTGPGLVITVDDAASADQQGSSNDVRDRVLDIDLQSMVNGLWLAGAEAVAINGHRLSTLTAIRGAGDAITVDYRSLTRPYRVEAIGDSKTLQAHYVESAGGAWWNELKQNRQMRYEISSAKEITLSADPGMVLRYAKRASR
jgi:uncharacterized protein YlxW (UPF0749 family)